MGVVDGETQEHALTDLSQRHYVVKHKGECLNQAADCTPIQLCILVFCLTHMGVVTGETQEHALVDALRQGTQPQLCLTWFRISPQCT